VKQVLQNLKHSAIDWRMALMAGVLLVITVIFNILSGGIFFSAENLYNVAQQTAVVGILATVMVLVIVTRNIDLSVGSTLGFVGVLIAF
jgi:D-xylose transport system permease protein